MKIIATLLFSLILAGSVFAANSSGYKALSVEAAVRLALKNNPNLRAARHRIEQARARHAMARSAFSPHLGFDFGYMRGDAPSAYLFKRIDSRELPAMTDFNDPGSFGNVEAGLTVRYNLWDNGRKKLGAAQAKSGMEAGEKDRDAVINELIGAVIQSYFNVLAAKEYVKVAEHSLETVKSQLKATRARHKLGGALRSDVLSLEVREAQGRERLITARNGIKLSRAALRRLLDMSPSEKLELSGREWKPSELPETLEDCLNTAYEHRAEFKALSARLEGARSGHQLSRKQFSPRLDMVGRYWADDNALNLTADRANWTIGATMTWQLSDGGGRKAKRREAEAVIKELEAGMDSLKRAIEVSVYQAFLKQDEARARLEVSRVNGERAEETLKLVKQQYAGGMVTVTRYLQSETERTEAMFRAIRARYDVKKANAALGHVLGLCAYCAKGWKEQ